MSLYGEVSIRENMKVVIIIIIIIINIYMALYKEHSALQKYRQK